jgi:ABC-2 type transport system permease protein
MPASPLQAAPSPLLAVWSLAAREWLRFVRQRNRVIGAIGQPLLFWLFFSEGLGPTFQLPGAESGGDNGVGFREYFFPGTLVLILLFTAIFTTISIIEDRREGFLQSVLVAPLSRGSMVAGKLLGGTAIALAQGLLFLLLGFTLDLPLTPLAFVHAAAYCGMLALGLTGLGFLIAWRMESTQGFHAIMSVFLLPLWLLSGAFFPPPDGWLGAVMKCNPLTYAVAGLRRLLYGGDLPAGLTDALPPLSICWGVTAAFAAAMFAGSCLIARGRTRADLL